MGTEAYPISYRPLVHLLTFSPSVWIIGHVVSGWDGLNALESQSNLCECHAFTHSFDELTSSSSLPDVSRYQPFILPFDSSDISVDRFSPHVIASELFEDLR